MSAETTISVRLPDGTMTPPAPISVVRAALDEIKAKDRKIRKAPPVKETPADAAVADQAYSVAADELRQFVERAEQLALEKKDIADQEKELFAEAKGRGFNTKVMRKLIALRKRKPDDLAEEDAVLEIYKAALGMA